MTTLAESLVEHLDRNLQARRRELSEIKLMVQSASPVRQRILTRAGQVLAYAHWEGFTKECIASYLEYIESKRCRVEDLVLHLKAVSISGAINAADSAFHATLAILNSHASADAVFASSARDLVRTGNLDSSMLRKLFFYCALDYRTVYETRENYIDQVLCGRRHRIAHGQMEPISCDELYELIDEWTSLCDEINDQIQESVVYEKYLTLRSKGPSPMGE